MRALDDSLRGLPPASAGKGTGRAGGKEQAGGAFEDAVANAGRQKANDQAGTDKGLGDTAAGDDTEAGALIDKDNIARSAGRHGAATRSIAIGRDEQALGEHADRFPATERDLGARRAANKADTAKANADPAGLNNATVPDELAEHIAALAERLAKTQANGETTAAGDADAATGEGGEATSTSKTDMDDLLTLLAGGQAFGETTKAGRQVAAGQGEAAGMHVAGTGEHGAKAEVTAGEGDPDRLFRFARADGKGQAVTMSLSKDGDAAFDGTRSQAAKVENVTVLEARRYLGISMNPNTSAVADAIAGEVSASPLQPSAALSQPGAWTQAGKTLNTLKIQLHPIELGLVTATLRLKDDELQVELKVETGEAFRQLRDDQSEMVKALRAQGFAVDQVNIVFNSGGDTSSGGGSQAQAQAQAGQQGRERADGNGQGRQQRQDDGQASMAERWVGNGGTDDAAAGTERSRTGHVYM
ncbi:MULTISPECIES: flagellar hook-length control protein FliK [Ensifer]|uniref:flagellar hook-length control protein FliK n=1 Tax=Ensifer TaxID=106591 RepID=UPI000807438B|nr:flagellar hook-length control protein FliK [Ensifer adhaerens]